MNLAHCEINVKLLESQQFTDTKPGNRPDVDARVPRFGQFPEQLDNLFDSQRVGDSRPLCRLAHQADWVFD
jgi:hypothetical protein